MATSTDAVLASYVTSRTDCFDGLRLVPVPFVPEIRLYLADDAVVLRARLEAEVGPVPGLWWGSAWAGGQALARYVLDHPHVVAGQRVLDVASGSGLVGIAAAMSGAAAVTANDIDPYAMAAIAMNATVNGVAVAPCSDDLLGGDGDDADVVLAGDAFYNPALAARMQAFLHRVAARGARVLIGDPDRGHLPRPRLETVASYRVGHLGTPEDAQITQVAVLQPV